VYEADGIAECVEFKLSPSIRGPEHTHAGYTCIDEDNCDNELYFLCGQSLGGGVEWLACLDAGDGSPASIAQSCASTSKLDWSKLSTCFGGDQGKTLLRNASLYFDNKFPHREGVPDVFIDGKDVGFDDRNYAALIKSLCAKEISAGVCSNAVVV